MLENTEALKAINLFRFKNFSQGFLLGPLSVHVLDAAIPNLVEKNLPFFFEDI